ncbi:hypothetical protein D3C78_1645410 [compost metagenome]
MRLSAALKAIDCRLINPPIAFISRQSLQSEQLSLEVLRKDRDSILRSHRTIFRQLTLISCLNLQLAIAVYLCKQDVLLLKMITGKLVFEPF